MKSTEKYIQDLKQWLADTRNSPLEEMADFFRKRLHDYEEHMSVWEESYRVFAGSLPPGCRNILDLGCGSGLELDKIWAKDPGLAVTGVDLCQDMLDRLQKKHSDKLLTLVCEDYFRYDPGSDKWDAVISFESLHHFLPEPKKVLYQKIFCSLKAGGVFLLGDYIACCDEEEELLRSTYLDKREKSAIPSGKFVHFDIPLTLGHESALLEEAGFVIEKVTDVPDGATIILAGKGKAS